MRTPGIRQYLAFLVLAALVPAIGLALALFFLSLRGEYEVSWQRSAARTTFIAAAVQTQMDALAGTLDVLSANPALAMGDLTGFHAQARAITGERVDAVSLVRPDGITIMNSRVLPGITPPVFSVPVSEVKRALDENRIVVSHVFEGATSKRPIFAMMKPVRVHGNIHVLAVGLFASRFMPLIDRTQPPWNAALLDAAATPIAVYPSDGALGPETRAAIMDSLASRHSGRLSIPMADGDEYMLVYEQIPLSQWIAVSALPRAQVGRPALENAFHYAAGAFLLSLPSGFLALWLGWRLMRSMQSLARFAAAMADESETMPRSAPRGACQELDVMAESLERAACEVAARDSQLRQERDLAEQRAEHIRTQSEELSRSNTDLEQFAYVVSHDLREPLRMVSSFLTLLERRLGATLDGEPREFMNFARDGARRMDEMILDLLQYSRLGRIETPIAMTDLNVCVAAALSQLAGKIHDTGGSVSLDTPLPTLPGHPNELERLFTNLIGNALKYHAPDRTPNVHVSATPTANGWQISVSDNGIGIDPQFHQRIFAIFQRLHTRDRYDGNGIGLSICKKIVEHHKGRIWVDSVPGEGSTFHCTLALQPPEENRQPHT